MKFIADVNVEKPVVDYLLESGHDVKWIPDYNCQMSDEELLNLAKNEKRILITNDKGFGELIFLQKKVVIGIILFRIKGHISQEKIRLMKLLLDKYQNKLLGHYVIVSKNKIRFIPLEETK
jgi:predicted nuclease of predicted toxin-antitoxin system